MSEANITFTNNAAKKVHELISDEGDLELCLRIAISGGGCSGFQYIFTFDKIKDSDNVIIKELEEEGGEDGGKAGTKVRLIIDSISFQYLMGASIDFKTDANGEQFVIKNPNAQTTCGCGSSFSM